MKHLRLLPLLLLASCSSTFPIDVSYTGTAAGHTYSAGYKTGKGIIATASAK